MQADVALESRLDGWEYKNRYCHAFALAASGITGYPMRALRQKVGRSSETLHVYVEMPDGNILDASGVSPYQRMHENFAGFGEVPGVAEECWCEHDIKLAVRRGDLIRLTAEDMQIARADVETLLRQEAEDFERSCLGRQGQDPLA